MPLSKYIKNNVFLSSDIKASLVCLLLGLQVAVWYPVLSRSLSDVNTHSLIESQIDTAWQQTQHQAQRIKQLVFSDMPWVQHKVIATLKGLPTQWQVEGTASILEWQHFQETVEEKSALTLRSAVWKRQTNGQWYGRLEMSMAQPVNNRTYQNWLPVRLRTDRFHPNDWQILSTMRNDAHASALISYQNNPQWVTAGAWLPEAGVTVQSVSLQSITLVAVDGVLQTIETATTGGQGD